MRRDWKRKRLEGGNQSHSLGLVWKMLSFARPFWLSMAVLFGLTLLSAPIALLKPVAMKIVIDNGFGGSPLTGIPALLAADGASMDFTAVIALAVLFLLAVAVVDNVNGYLLWLLSTRTGEKLVLKFRMLLFDHSQRLSIAYHDRMGTSDALYRIQWDTMSVRALLLEQITALLSSFITLFSMVIVMLTIDWRFALIALLIIPPLYYLTRLRARRMRKDWYRVKDDESHVMSVIHEVLGSLRVVKAFGQEENENSRFLERSNRAVEGQLRMAHLGARFQFATGMVFTAGSMASLWFGAHQVHAGSMTLGELTMVMAYLAQVFGPLQNISRNITEVQSSLVSVERVFSILDIEPEVEDDPKAQSLGRVKGDVEFEGVSFSYDGERPILEDVSFSVKAGDRVGIMGSTGAGKSTLVSLLNRFYDPHGGTVRVDGQDIRSYRLKDYRSQFSMVLQDPVLFSTTIAENIRYGRPEATDEEVMEAAKAAHAHEFIMRGKDGYNTLVGDRGMQLSGGERQRISIARAFIKDAPILILDEPTSSLDVRTETQIMDAMERLMEGRTTFMITHRLDTLGSCNIILHLENGRLFDVARDYDVDALIRSKKDYFKGMARNPSGVAEPEQQNIPA
jgi:ATP-binding cassette subfamily B protein